MFTMKRLSLFISLSISLIGILIVQSMFTTHSVDPSQNKYLGFIGIIFVTPFILLSLFITYRYFYLVVKNTGEKRLVVTYILGCFVLLLLLTYFSFQYKGKMGENLSTFQFPPLNEKTYPIYFNFYTFAFIHTLSALFGSIFGSVKK